MLLRDAWLYGKAIKSNKNAHFRTTRAVVTFEGREEALTQRGVTRVSEMMSELSIFNWLEVTLILPVLIYWTIHLCFVLISLHAIFLKINKLKRKGNKTQGKQAKNLNRWHLSYHYTLGYEPYSNGHKFIKILKYTDHKERKIKTQVGLNKIWLSILSAVTWQSNEKANKLLVGMQVETITLENSLKLSAEVGKRLTSQHFHF